jgi:hypothetical protein
VFVCNAQYRLVASGRTDEEGLFRAHIEPGVHYGNAYHKGKMGGIVILGSEQNTFGILEVERQYPPAQTVSP